MKKNNEVKKNLEAAFTMEEIENIMADRGLSFDPIDEEHVNLKKGNRIVLKNVRILPEESDNSDNSEKSEKQVHIPRDRDIKLESIKVGDIGVKIIYHRMKDSSKQYRIFLAQKIDGKLVRTRLVNEDIKKIDTDEEKMLAYYHKITKSETSLKKVI